MQCFLPYESFRNTAQCLDRQRLSKQRVEAYQLLLGCQNPEIFGWKNHPAFKMWKDHPRLLSLYGLEICGEWIKRGYKDTLMPKFYSFLVYYDNLWFDNKYSENMPVWLGDKSFHDSHKSNLMRKLPEWYNRYGWEVSDNLPYVWPSNKKSIL